MVRKIISLAVMVLALLSLQLGPATMARASVNPNMIHAPSSMRHQPLLSGHHNTHFMSVEHSVAHHRAMNGKCCLFHGSACDMMVLSEYMALYQRHDERRAYLPMAVSRLPSFFVPAALRPPISSFA